MTIRRAVLVSASVIGLAMGTTGVAAATETDTKVQHTRRLPVDSGSSDALLPPTPRPILRTDELKVAANDVQAADRDNYQSRERDAQQLEQFRGGEGASIYIGGGALTVVVLVVLLVVLL